MKVILLIILMYIMFLKDDFRISLLGNVWHMLLSCFCYLVFYIGFLYLMSSTSFSSFVINRVQRLAMVFFFFVEQTFFTCFRKVSGSCFPALPYWWSLNTRFIGCLQTKQAEHFILVLIFLFFKFVALYIFSCHFVCFLILSNISWIKVEPCLDVMSKKVAERKNVLSLVLWCYQDITFFDMQHFIRQY